jgi:MFS family permease
MRRVFPFVCAAVLVDTMFFAAITPLLPSYQDELGLSKTSAGILSAAYPAGTLLFSLPAGWLAGRIGAKATAVTGLALIAVTSVAFGHGESIGVLDSARFVQGVGGACTWAGALAWLMGVTAPERRGQAIGAALGAALFGVLLGPVIGGAATEAGPELVFSGVGAVATLMLLWALVIPGSEAHTRSSWRDLAVALRSRSLQTAMWLFLLPALFIGTIDVLVPLRLDDLGARGLTIGALFVAAAAIEGLLNPVMGRLSDTRGRVPLIRVGLVGGGLTAVALPLPATVWLLGALLLVAVTWLAFFWAPAAAMLSDSSEALGLDQGFAFGIMNLAWAAGQVAGGAAGGALADVTSDAVPYALLSLLCVGTLMLARERGRVPAGS